MRITERLYQAITRKISSLMPAQPSHGGEREEKVRAKCAARAPGIKRYWFHGASAGELESLWTLVDQAGETGGEVWLTVFSASGLASVERLASDMRKAGHKLLFAGFSPREGFWREALEMVQPDVFVTAKYEAWPELWMALAEKDIPLVLVGARNRPSVRIAKRVCSLFAGKIPRMALLAATEADMRSLVKLFPKAQIETSGDPRWDRVHARAHLGHPRAKDIVAKAKWLAHPWGIMGSAWLEDLEFLGKKLTEIPGTIWVVPHHVDERTVGLIERHLQQFSQSIIRSSQSWQGISAGALKPRFIVVDEMGFLSELYSHGDWAFVGGGFGKGIHSTIEPAIQGIAVAGGAKGSHRFPEVSALEALGQLKILRTQSDLDRWIAVMRARNWGGREAAWSENVSKSLGASERVWKVILQAADGRLLT